MSPEIEYVRQLAARFTGLVDIERSSRIEIVRKIDAALTSIEEQLEALRQGLRESWDDYANAIDEHTSEEVRLEARRRMLKRFSSYQDEGWLLEADAGAVSPTGSSASTPASEPQS